MAHVANGSARKEARRETARRNLDNAGHASTCFGNCRQSSKRSEFIRVMTCQKQVAEA